jgi:hypothetical protein
MHVAHACARTPPLLHTHTHTHTHAQTHTHTHSNTLHPKVTDIVICNGKLAVSVSYKTSTNAQLRGRAWFFAVGEAPLLLGFTTLGFLPDSLTWSADCGTLLASNEAEPNSYGQATSFDPEGSVSVVDVSFEGRHRRKAAATCADAGAVSCIRHRCRPQAAAGLLLRRAAGCKMPRTAVRQTHNQRRACRTPHFENILCAPNPLAGRRPSFSTLRAQAPATHACALLSGRRFSRNSTPRRPSCAPRECAFMAPTRPSLRWACLARTTHLLPSCLGFAIVACRATSGTRATPLGLHS